MADLKLCIFALVVLGLAFSEEETCSPEEIMKTKSSPEEIMKVKGSPDEIMKTKDSPEKIMKTKGSPEKIMKTKGLPEEIMKVKGSPEEIMKTKGLPEEIMKVKGSPEEIMKVKGSPEKIMKVKCSSDAIIIMILKGVPEEIMKAKCSPEELIKVKGWPRVSREQNKLRDANNNFAMNLYLKLAAKTNDNVLISPFTLASILSIFYSGARGETAREFRKLLGFARANIDEHVLFSSFNYYLAEILPKLDPHSYSVHPASVLISDKTIPLLPEFKSKIQDKFQAYIEAEDTAEDAASEAEKKVNTWAKSKTRWTIKPLVEGIDPDTSLLLVSAVYFKGTWQIKFDPKETKFLPFFNYGEVYGFTYVPMMHTVASYRYHVQRDFRAIEMVYEGNDTSMMIFLPSEMDGLQYIELRHMTHSEIVYVRERMHYTRIRLTLPKFKLGFDQDLSKYLQDLGLKKVFRPGANFSGMTKVGYSMILNEVRHKATIEVDEEGTIAEASSSSSVIMTQSIQFTDMVPEFIVDRPFFFAIIDLKHSIILFIGRVHRL